MNRKLKKVLWVCNIMLPAIGQQLNLSYSNREGWLSGIFDRAQEEGTPFLLGICFPLSASELDTVSGEYLGESNTVKKLMIRKITCYAFKEDLNTPEKYDTAMEKTFQEIIRDFQPDLLHAFGTEFPHTLAAVKAYHTPERTLIGIQGLCSEIAGVYMAGLPEKVQNRATVRDRLRRDSLKEQYRKFCARGENEAQAIKLAGNITGRTDFDRQGTAGMNPDAAYYFMNETMRSNFYRDRWMPEECEKHSIFLGQGDYPLKGMHFVLEAMAILKPGYPDMKLYVAGNSIIGQKSLKERIKRSSYGKYLLELLQRYKLTEQVILTGKLDAAQMKQRFLSSSVFVCASVLENSPNTVGEAMLLGMPVVAFRTGGIPNMITHGENGLLVPVGDTRALAGAIDTLWKDMDADQGIFTGQLIEHAYSYAHQVHDGETNYKRLLEIYDLICDRAEESRKPL